MKNGRQKEKKRERSQRCGVVGGERQETEGERKAHTEREANGVSTKRQRESGGLERRQAKRARAVVLVVVNRKQKRNDAFARQWRG